MGSSHHIDSSETQPLRICKCVCKYTCSCLCILPCISFDMGGIFESMYVQVCVCVCVSESCGVTKMDVTRMSLFQPGDRGGSPLKVRPRPPMIASTKCVCAAMCCQCSVCRRMNKRRDRERRDKFYFFIYLFLHTSGFVY